MPLVPTATIVAASALPYAQNVAATAELAAWCHERGIFVEAELGEVGGKNGVHAPGARTDPGEALTFVRDTGVDALAVAVGSSHAMTTRTMMLDKDLIAALRAKLPVPLVRHGSSGEPDEEIRRAIAAGMTKINISAHLVSVFTATVRDVPGARPDLVDSRKYLGPAADAVTGEAARLLRGGGRPGASRSARAAATSGCCRRYRRTGSAAFRWWWRSRGRRGSYRRPG